MDKLKPCPCGKTPDSLGYITDPPAKYIMAMPMCCNDWIFEFRAGYTRDRDELAKLAADAWNDLPRKENGLT